MPTLPAVLIVDDDSIYQLITSNMVKKMGMTALAASDGIEAIQTFEEHEERVCCILLDIQMPNMCGIQTLKHFRKKGTDVPIIIVSGYLDKTKREQLDTLRPSGYLTKPIDFQILSDKIKSVIGI